jgi:hypothetical protein
MAIHMVMLPPDMKGSPATASKAELERIVFIKDGFCWPALFLPLPWLLVRRLWLVLIVFLLFVVAMEVASRLIGGPAPGVVTLLATTLFAFEANGLRRWTLEQRGWRFAAVVEAGNRDDAERRFFTAALAPAAGPPAASPPGNPAGDADFHRHGPTPQLGGGHVVGLSLARPRP